MTTDLPFARALVALLIVTVQVAAAQTIPPDGDNFRVNDDPVSIQRDAAIATTDADGGSVVVWGRSDGPAIFGRRLDPTGMPVGPDFRIDTGGGFDPAVASGLAGDFIVVWARPNLDAIVARLFDASGAVTAEIPLFEVDPGPVLLDRPSVARDAFGGAVVVWQSSVPSQGQVPVVRGQRLSPTGDLLGSLLFIANGMNSQVNPLPTVANDLFSGDFLVAWRADSGEISARLFDPDGVPAGAPFRVNDTVGVVGQPFVTSYLQGDFVVVWEMSEDIFVKRIGSTGEPIGPELSVNTTTAGVQSIARAAFGDLDGNLMVAWQSQTPAGDREIRARWFAHDFDQAGVTAVDDFVVDTFGTGDQFRPVVTGDLSGGFTVAWDGAGAGDGWGIFAQRYAPPVLLTVNDFSVVEGDPATGPEVPDSTAQFTVELSRPHPLFDQGVEITLDFQTLDNTASFLEDYELLQGSVLFDETTPLAQSVAVQITGDTVFEEDETFFLELSEAVNAVITRPQGLATIENDDPAGSLSIDDVSQAEGDSGSQSLLFTVSLAPAQQADALVSFATLDDTATAGSDYEATSGVLTIPAGASQGFISVEVFGDTVIEEDETFFVDLSDAHNGTLVDARGVGTIVSDENCSLPPTIDPTSASLPVEGGSGSVAVTDGAGCGWTVENPVPWVTVLAPTPGEPQVGNGQVDYEVAVNPELNPRQGTLAIAGSDFVIDQAGVLCSYAVTPLAAGFPSAGGTGVVAVETSEAICQWEALSNAPWLTLESSPNCPPGSGAGCQHGGTGGGTVEYAVAANPGAQRTGTLTVAVQTVTVDQDGIFLDHFDDDVLDPEWSYDPAGSWSEADSVLTGNAVGLAEPAEAIADPAFRGCSECTIEADLRIALFGSGTATLYGWYLGADDHFALTMDELANTWTLTQRLDGVGVATTSSTQSILVGELYGVVMTYDGSEVSVRVDGLAVLSMAPAPGTTPDGTVGLRVDDTEAGIDRIRVVTVTGPFHLFEDGFESGDTLAWDATVD